MNVQAHSPSDPIYFGRRFRPYVAQGYMSGGAGYVLSREALDRFVLRAMRDVRRCRRDMVGVEDVEVGQCLASVGVAAADSRDEHGRERFHPFTPDLHLIRGRVPRDNWYWKYNYYPAREVCLLARPASVELIPVAPGGTLTINKKFRPVFVWDVKP